MEVYLYVWLFGMLVGYNHSFSLYTSIDLVEISVDFRCYKDEILTFC